MHAAAVHFIFEANHGRPVEMPGQPLRNTPRRPSSAFEKREDILHGVELHGGGLLPSPPNALMRRLISSSTHLAFASMPAGLVSPGLTI